MPRWARTAAVAVEEPAAAEPQAPEIPGLREAEAELREAQRASEGVKLDKARAEQAERERKADLAELGRRRDERDRTVTPADIEAAKTAIADAAEWVVHYKNAIPGAKARVTRAEQGVARVLRDECKRLGPLAIAEDVALQQRGREMLELGGTLQTRGSELRSVGNNTAAKPDEVRAMLAHAARVGIA
ncbi:MAG: hypothetical protein ICV73_20235 [Acetobacteraceae bacterium]|nr:hypothetical protein [Acetobacteraceae bacterium]